MKDRDERLETMSAKVKELKASLKERGRAVEDLERRMAEQSSALEAGKSRMTEFEASSAEMQAKLSESRRTVIERDEQLQTLRDELKMVSENNTGNLHIDSPNVFISFICICIPQAKILNDEHINKQARKIVKFSFIDVK